MQNLSFVIASGLGGLAGIFFSLYIGVVNPVSGLNIGMTAFVAAALGGLGSLVGAVVGGFVLGILEAFGIYWLGWSWGPLAGERFLPRVSYGRAVLARAQWTVDGDDLKPLLAATGVERFRRVQRWRRERALPRFTPVSYTHLACVPTCAS